jgi:hypothetical protein
MELHQTTKHIWRRKNKSGMLPTFPPESNDFEFWRSTRILSGVLWQANRGFFEIFTLYLDFFCSRNLHLRQNDWADPTEYSSAVDFEWKMWPELEWYYYILYSVGFKFRHFSKVHLSLGMRGTLLSSCPFWIRFCQLNFYQKFPNIFGGKNWQVNLTPSL